jgi:hypothetical protein
MTAPKLTPETIAELRKLTDGHLGLWFAELLDAYETLAAQRDRYETALREIAQYTCHNEESRIVRDIARRAIEEKLG